MRSITRREYYYYYISTEKELLNEHKFLNLNIRLFEDFL